jgi:hypothetical protein
MMRTFVVEDAAIFQGEYAGIAFVHVLEVMADLEPNEIT